MQPNWKQLSLQKIIAVLGVEPSVGLSSKEVAARREQYGENRLPEPRRTSVVSLWVRQFKNPLVGILLLATATLFLIEHLSDGSVLLIVVLINSFIGTFHEFRAQKTVTALRALTHHTAVVRRAGEIHRISAHEVVPGDVLLLHEGDHIVADARLVDTSFMRVNESILTGESVPAQKDAQASPEHDDAPTHPSFVYAGTAVTHGSATALVFATASTTRIGKISTEIKESHTPIPLETDLRTLSRVVIVVVVVLAGIVVALGSRAHMPMGELLFIGVALAVSAIPEGLPVVLSIVLATGMYRMARRHALVKKLFAVEALGQTRVLALDKTGTLTFNEMIVSEVHTASDTITITGEGYAPHGTFFHDGAVIEPSSLHGLRASLHLLPTIIHARSAYGDPTEMALHTFARKLDISKRVAVAHAMPFDYQKRYSLSEVTVSARASALAIAGAPEVVLAACTRVNVGEREQELTTRERDALAAHVQQMAERGLRIIAFAHKTEPRYTWNPDAPQHGYTFEAFFGLRDALRPHAAPLIARVKSAGVRVVMITGDLPTTARAVAREVGIFEHGDHIITGAELHELSDHELRALLPRASVFARVSPEDKLRIIELFQREGLTIAMTGDGVNDAPSLVKADLGVAMSRTGTDVARQAADVLLLNDNLEAIGDAIEEGRVMYHTMRKVLMYLFATNFGELCLIGAAFALGLPVPLVAVQIVWLNLVTDGFLDVAMALEPREDNNHMPAPRRSRSLLRARDTFSLLITGAVMTAGTLTLFVRHSDLPLDERRSLVLVTIALFQWVHAWMMRTERRSAFSISPLRNPYLIGATVVVFTLQIIALYVPFMNSLLHTTPLSASLWIEAIVVAAVAVVVEEAKKWWRRRN